MPWTRRSFVASLGGLAAAAPPPYLDRTRERTAVGEAEEPPPPAGLREIPIGYFGPEDDLLRAVEAVFEEANRQGGIGGLPFRLIRRWTTDPWRAAARMVVELAYQERVYAVLTAAGSDSVHLAEQVAVKTRLPLLDLISTDRSVNAAMVPWAFSLLPADPAIAAAVGAQVLADGAEPFTLLSATSHDERLLVREFLRFFGKQRVSPERHLEFAPGGAVELEARRAVIVAPPADTARLARQLAGARLYAGPAAGRAAFLRAAGAAADGIVYPVLARTRAGEDYARAQCRDGARLLIEAVRVAGPSRNGIRQALTDLTPWQGLAGRVEWNALNRNTRSVHAARLSLKNEWELSLIKES